MMMSDNTRGLILAVLSSAFIGASFILKKKGLRRAGAAGTRAGVGGYTYLLEPLWWAGMVTSKWSVKQIRLIYILLKISCRVTFYYLKVFYMNSDCWGGCKFCCLCVCSRCTRNSFRCSKHYCQVKAKFVLNQEICRICASNILNQFGSAVLAHFMLKERLQKLGVLGCISCIVGSVVIVIHAPQESTPSSVEQIWTLATQPAFIFYTAAALSVVVVLVIHFEPRYGQTNILVYLGVCSLMGSLTVVSIKAIGIAIKLTIEGISQIAYPQTWFFVTVAALCVITQLNYLNKALDTFNTSIVSPIYYVMFTTLTIVASAIMFKDWSGQNASSIASEICGFITVLSGTIILHSTREQEPASASGSISWYVRNEDSLKGFEDDHFITLRSSDYFD